MLFFRAASRHFPFGLLATALLWLPVFCGAAGKSTPASISAPALFPDAFREVIERGVNSGAYRSVAVGLIEGKQRRTIYFGHRTAADSAPADDTSLFEIGAASEVFTGLLLAQAAIEGKLLLHDPLRQFLSPEFPFGTAATGTISLDALVTQHSGLPAQPASLFPADLDDPYADYAAEDLLAFLAFDSRPIESSDTYRYSVLNFGLLGHLLGRIYATPFAEVLKTKILAPLGLAHATFDDPPTLLPGHARGTDAAHWHYGVLAGTAGLRASLPDLLDFLQHNLTPDDSPLRGALLLTRQPRATGPVDQIGLGWNVREVQGPDGSWPLVWRASETAGFATFLGFRTDKQRAIVLLGNAAEDLAELGIAWLSETEPPSPPRGYSSASSNTLDAYPGLYQLISGGEMIVRGSAAGLSAQLPGLPPQRLHAVDKDVFVADGHTFGVTFMRNIDEINGLVLHLDGDHVSARRLSNRAPQLARTPVRLDAHLRDDLRGDYRIDGSTWMRIADSGNGLSLQSTASERLHIFPYAPDRFSDSNGTLDLSVHRDAQGRISRLTLDLAGEERDAVPLRAHATGNSP